MSHELFVQAVHPLRQGMLAELQTASNLPIGSKEKIPLAKTVRTCRQLLQLESALWTFVHTPGVEPTNNAVERALRPAVLTALYQLWRSVPGGQSVCRSDADGEDIAQGSRTFRAGVLNPVLSVRTLGDCRALLPLPQPSPTPHAVQTLIAL